MSRLRAPPKAVVNLPMPLNLTDLSYEVEGASVLDNINLSLEDRTVAAVREPTGAGKTTLGLIVTKLVPTKFEAAELQFLPRRSWNYLCGNLQYKVFETNSPSAFLPSNPLETLIFPSVQDELETVTDNEETIVAALDTVGLPREALSMELTHLSGGQLQRLVLARTLLREPRLLVADETYEWLDEQGGKTFMKILNSLADRGGVALLLQSTATPQLDGVPTLAMRNSQGCSGRRRTGLKWLGIRGSRGKGSGDEVLNIECLKKDYHSGGKQFSVLSSASFYGRRGEWIGIRGANGAGKSVLCRIVAGLERESGGKIAICGSSAGLQERRRRVGYVFQIPHLQLPFPTLGDLLRATVVPLRREKVIQGIREMVPAAGRNSKMWEMTPFQQRVVIICILLSNDTDILILDEPSWGSDADEVRRLLTKIAGCGGEDRLTLVVSHNEDLLKGVCDRSYVMRFGSLGEGD